MTAAQSELYRCCCCCNTTQICEVEDTRYILYYSLKWSKYPSLKSGYPLYIYEVYLLTIEWTGVH